MSRIETRIASVQIVPGFPACLTILNPPGWDAPPTRPSPSTHRYPSAGGEYIPVVRRLSSPQKIEDSEEDVSSNSGIHFSPEVYSAHTPSTLPTRETEVEAPPVSEFEASLMSGFEAPLVSRFEETSMPGGESCIDDTTSNQPALPFTSHVG